MPHITERSENKILSDIEKIASTENYIHVISALVFRDYCISVDKLATRDNFEHLNAREIAVLMAMWLKNSKGLYTDNVENLPELMNSTDELFTELHHLLSLKGSQEAKKKAILKKKN